MVSFKDKVQELCNQDKRSGGKWRQMLFFNRGKAGPKLRDQKK
jgi:hypothetical protein